MMGLLDGFGMDDPQTMGLLSAAGNMMAASGPSRMPVSAGQVLNAGLQGGIAGYKGTMDRAHEEQALQLQNAQLLQALRQGQITQAVYQKVLERINGGGGAPGASGTPVGGMPGGQSGGSLSVPAQQPGAPIGAAGAQTGDSSFGLSNDAMLGGMLAGPGELGKAIVSANAPTDFTKQLRQAGIDPNSQLGRQILQQQIAKLNNIPLQAGRAGAPMFDPQGNIVAMAPKIPDNAIPQVVNGKVVGVSMLPGAAGVEQTNAYAGAAGKAQATPISGVDASGQPVFTNALTAAGGGGSAGAPGADIPWTGSGPISADRLAAARQAAAGIPAGAIRPAAAPGYNTSQEKLAGAAADRYNGLIGQAADSPTRVNVYDNILNLSKQGVQTGPSAEWNNKIKGYAASVPGIDGMFPGMKKDVSNFQELNKFMYQNAQRNWQAAGGTGTDSQLEAFSKANPNSSMFPQALQAMAEWGKAGELALQGRANATQQWKDANGGNVANLDQFDRAWRNNFDPMLFQLKTMDPAAAAQMVNNLKTTNPKGYSLLMMKAQALKNLGGL